MGFVKTWFTCYFRPDIAFSQLKGRKGFYWGLWGILITWGMRDLLYLVPHYLMGSQPFEPSYLTFLSTENYYSVWIYLQPVMGLMLWLLNSAMIYFVFRLLKKEIDFDNVLNITGLSAVVISLPLLLADWIIYFADLRTLTAMAVLHTLFTLWSMILQIIAYKKLFGIRVWVSSIILILLFPFIIVIPAIFSR